MASRARVVVGLVVMLPGVFVLSAAGGGSGAEAGVGTGAGMATASAAASTAAAGMEGNESPVLLTGRVADPHQAGVVWLAETGHTLRGAFLDYWNRYGGLAQFGYPLTEEFYEPLGPPPEHKQYLVQYFERNRFELHPENAGTPYEVLLGALGREFHSQDPPAPALPGATYFPQTGHNLSGVFKAYWEGHGGLFVHGYPITEQLEEESPTDHKMYLVQYFERSRFERHPENAGTTYEVLLGLLGRQLSEKKGYPYGWYPRWGRAAGWSWVSGDFVPPCAGDLCSCNFFRIASYLDRYPHDTVHPRGTRPGDGFAEWVQATGGPGVNYWVPLVLFGTLTNPNPSNPACGVDVYVTDRVQDNPAGAAP